MMLVEGDWMSTVNEVNAPIQNDEKIKLLVEQIVDSVNTVGYPLDSDRIKDKYNKLKSVHRLQKSIVRQNIHNAMSPLSAISGYLELINLSLMDEDPDVEQVDFYRRKIERGVKEVSTILEQLHGIYTDESDAVTEDSETIIDVDLNWLVREVCSKMHFTESDIKLDIQSNLLHVQTDIFIAKLIVFNLINYASKCNKKGKRISLTTDQTTMFATFTVEFEASDMKRRDIQHVIKSANKFSQSLHSDNSFDEGLLTSVRLAREIQGKVDFISENRHKVQITLSIPSAI